MKSSVEHVVGRIPAHSPILDKQSCLGKEAAFLNILRILKHNKMLASLIRAHDVLDRVVNLAYHPKASSELKRIRITAANDRFVDLGNSLSVLDSLLDEVDDMACAPQTILTGNRGDLSVHCGHHCVVIARVVHCERSELASDSKSVDDFENALSLVCSVMAPPDSRHR